MVGGVGERRECSTGMGQKGWTPNARGTKGYAKDAQPQPQRYTARRETQNSSSSHRQATPAPGSTSIKPYTASLSSLFFLPAQTHTRYRKVRDAPLELLHAVALLLVAAQVVEHERLELGLAHRQRALHARPPDAQARPRPRTSTRQKDMGPHTPQPRRRRQTRKERLSRNEPSSENATQRPTHTLRARDSKSYLK